VAEKVMVGFSPKPPTFTLMVLNEIFGYYFFFQPKPCV